MTKNLLIIAAIVLSGLLVVLGYSLYNITREEKAVTYIANEETTLAEQPTEATTIVVYITGAVENQGLYNMPAGSRLNDLIQKAGGFKPNAFIDDLNLAEVLKDEQKIKVKYSSDTVDKTENLSQNNSGALVDINKATKEELQSLDGVGEKIAAAIVEYRQARGNFDCIEEIKEVEGVGNALFNKIKDNITVSD